jgi:hypothetical protein
MVFEVYLQLCLPDGPWNNGLGPIPWMSFTNNWMTLAIKFILNSDLAKGLLTLFLGRL